MIVHSYLQIRDPSDRGDVGRMLKLVRILIMADVSAHARQTPPTTTSVSLVPGCRAEKKYFGMREKQITGQIFPIQN